MDAFEAIATIERLNWNAAMKDGLYLQTDHKHLVFSFGPCYVVSEMLKTKERKVLRWTVKLRLYNYVQFLVRGEEMFWADLLGRWSLMSVDGRMVSITPLISAVYEDFNWPDQQKVADLKSLNDCVHPPYLPIRKNVCVNEIGAVWVPDNATESQLRLFVIDNTIHGGNRGCKSMDISLILYSVLDYNGQ